MTSVKRNDCSFPWWIPAWNVTANYDHDSIIIVVIRRRKGEKWKKATQTRRSDVDSYPMNRASNPNRSTNDKVSQTTKLSISNRRFGHGKAKLRAIKEDHFSEN